MGTSAKELIDSAASELEMAVGRIGRYSHTEYLLTRGIQPFSHLRMLQLNSVCIFKAAMLVFGPHSPPGILSHRIWWSCVLPDLLKSVGNTPESPSQSLNTLQFFEDGRLFGLPVAYLEEPENMRDPLVQVYRFDGGHLHFMFADSSQDPPQMERFTQLGSGSDYDLTDCFG